MWRHRLRKETDGEAPPEINQENKKINENSEWESRSIYTPFLALKCEFYL